LVKNQNTKVAPGLFYNLKLVSNQGVLAILGFQHGAIASKNNLDNFWISRQFWRNLYSLMSPL
jgi:hypothetical protein